MPRRRPSGLLAQDGRRRSAASAIQDWLNASGHAAWGMCCNGVMLRLVRDNASLTRPAYIEADLRRIFEDEDFADFAALWLLVHASRFGAAGAPASDCALERWREAGQKEGIAARENLRDGVEAALLSLGNGFLSHSDNGALREQLRTGALPLPDFFGQLLRLVYRLIFLLAAEDRNLLHPPGASAPARKLYAEGYSRRRVARPRGAARRLGPASRPLGRIAHHLRGARARRAAARPARARRAVRARHDAGPGDRQARQPQPHGGDLPSRLAARRIRASCR